MNGIIQEFKGKYRFLSNFWPASVKLDNTIYPSVEHAYQAAKTLDGEEREGICRARTPGRAKREGRKVKIRGDWGSMKVKVMENLLRQKFATGELRSLLMQTAGRTLIEGNNWGDTFWGICKGRGRNVLGCLLMKIRDE